MYIELYIRTIDPNDKDINGNRLVYKCVKIPHGGYCFQRIDGTDCSHMGSYSTITELLTNTLNNSLGRPVELVQLMKPAEVCPHCKGTGNIGPVFETI